MSHLRLAVFDVDGTLVDSQHNIVSAMTEAWSNLNLGIPRPEQVRRIIGLSLVDACAVLLPWANPTVHRAVADAYKEAFRAMRLLPDTMEPLFPGVKEALDRLEGEGWLLGIATGSRGAASIPCWRPTTSRAASSPSRPPTTIPASPTRPCCAGPPPIAGWSRARSS